MIYEFKTEKTDNEKIQIINKILTIKKIKIIKEIQIKLVFGL